MIAGKGFLEFENPDSVKSFFQSPGIRPLRVLPNFDDLVVAAPNDKENHLLENYRQGVERFVHMFQQHSEHNDEDTIANAVEEWKLFFHSWPRSAVDLKLEPIDWNRIRSLEQGSLPR